MVRVLFLSCTRKSCAQIITRTRILYARRTTRWYISRQCPAVSSPVNVTYLIGPTPTCGPGERAVRSYVTLRGIRPTCIPRSRPNVGKASVSNKIIIAVRRSRANLNLLFSTGRLYIFRPKG